MMADTALLTSLITMALLLLVSAGLLGRDLFRGEQRLRHRLGGGVLLLAMVLSVGLYMTNGRLGMGDLPLSSRLDELAATQKKIDSAAMEKQHALARAKEMAEADPDNIETLFHLADAAAAAGDSVRRFREGAIRKASADRSCCWRVETGGGRCITGARERGGARGLDNKV